MTNVLTNQMTSHQLKLQFDKMVKSKVEYECFMCMEEFNETEYIPMIMCMNQHSCCASCMADLIKKDSAKLLVCPHCNLPIIKKAVTKNRLLITIYQLIDLFKSTMSAFQRQASQFKYSSFQGDTKASGIYTAYTNPLPLDKHSHMTKSIILPRNQTDEFTSSQSISLNLNKIKSPLISLEKRKEKLKIYADRQKIQELKTIISADIPLQQVSKLRSGYGCIRKIQCMEYFPNLKQLYLYNNLIHQIEGLNVNIKLNILSLANNRITSVDNIGHLKDMRRLSLEGNMLTKDSAEYLSSFEWNNLDTLNISFASLVKTDNDECIQVLFNEKNQWRSIKNIYIYNSKGLTEKSKARLKEFLKNRNGAKVYWN